MLISIVGCSSTTNTNTDKITQTATRITNIANTVNEISTILGGLNLSSTETSKVKSAITNYITNYNSLGDITSTTAKNQLATYKQDALGKISTAVGQNKYTQVIKSLGDATKSNNQNMSNETLTILSSLIK